MADVLNEKTPHSLCSLCYVVDMDEVARLSSHCEMVLQGIWNQYGFLWFTLLLGQYMIFLPLT